MNYCYHLYENQSFQKSTYDKNYAVYWLLNNYKKNVYVQILTYFEDNTELIPIDILKFNDNNLVKYNTFNQNYVTVYSPFDLELFQLSHLSLQYLQILNDRSIPIPVGIPIGIPVTQPPVQAQVQPESSSNHNNISGILTENNKLKKNIEELKKNINIESEDEESISSEKLKEIENNLNELLEYKDTCEKIHKKKEEEFMDIDCEARFQKRMEAKQKEILEEKKNILKNDLNLYIKFTQEKNFNESNIPILFQAKYYIIKFLFNEGYLEEEDINAPSDELYKLYTILYESHYDDKLDVHVEEFEDILNDYFASLPEDMEILSVNQIMSKLNEQSENKEIFNENVNFSESSNESESESESECSTQSECESD